MTVSSDQPPLWVSQWFASKPCQARLCIDDRFSTQVLKSGHWALLTCRVSAAGRADPWEFEQLARHAYSGILDRLSKLHPDAGRFTPARLWNFIPGIHEPCDDGLDRYMVFNRARYEALKSWLGQDPRKAGLLPTATGVGHDGSDLVISCLATDQRVVPVENPRQWPAYRYSSRYGPLPPCFARAGVWRGGEAFTNRSAVFVGGTASVLGEDSTHQDDLPAQLNETMVNLAAVLGAAEAEWRGASGHAGAWEAAAGGEAASGPQTDLLNQLTEVRVYHLRPCDAGPVVDLVTERLPKVQRVEMCQAQLCRPELLVEIEGLACAASVGGRTWGPWCGDERDP